MAKSYSLKLHRPRHIWATSLFSAIVAISGCHPGKGSNPEAPVDETVLRRGIGGEPSSLDPGTASDTFSYDVIRDLYEGLTTESSDGEILPGVAASWSVDQTRTEYTFKLRHNALWSNGTPVRAQDFVAAWRRAVDPKHASPVAEYLRLIINATEIISGQLSPSELGVHASHDDILVVRLTQPAPYFLQLLTHTVTFPVFSEENASSHTAQNWVSNGPYVLSRWIPGGNLVLKKNPRYWNANNTRISEVVYVPTTDDNSELQQYRAGQLDITQTIPSSAFSLLKKERPSEMLIAPFLGTVYYAINMHSAAYSSNAKLRQALAMAIDRRRLQSTILVSDKRPRTAPSPGNLELRSTIMAVDVCSR